MRNVDTTKACEHDGVGNKIIQLCCEFFGKFPFQWKLANFIPLFKKDDRRLKNNYRPVSLLSSLSKICEKIVFARLYDFLLDIGFLYKYQ